MSRWHVSYAKIGAGQFGFGSLEVIALTGILPRKGLSHKELEKAKEEVMSQPDHPKGMTVVILSFSRMEDDE